MCIICVDLEKNKLSPWEARRNLTEMIEKIGQEHAIEVLAKLSEIEEQEIFAENLLKYANFSKTNFFLEEDDEDDEQNP